MAVQLSDIITVNPGLSEIVRAAIVSNLKSPTIGDTFLHRNSQFERYRSSMIGDIAKLAVKRWFQRYRLTVTDWDDIRSSFRSSRKRFDLQVNNCAIEIASSLELIDKMSRNQVLTKILAEKHVIQPVRKTRKDIALQVYFISDIKPSVYIMGWVKWDNLLPFKTIRYIAGHPRDFWLVPFRHRVVHPPRDLINVLRNWS